MKIYALSDNVDMQTGLRLAGIDGAVVHTEEEVQTQLTRALSDESLGVLLVAEGLCERFADVIREVRLSRPLPLVVEIPDWQGKQRKQDFVSAYIREAIGITLS